MKLWAGQTVSQLGSQVTGLALPLTAVLALRASPAQMGALAAVQAAPSLLVGLFAGAWVDRVRRRPLLIAADLGRGLLLLSIPLTAMLGRLEMSQVYVVAFFVGMLGVVFDVAYQSFLPSVVHADELAEGNSKLALSSSVVQISGSGVAGALVQLVSAPVAIFGDALSFIGSALFTTWIRTSELGPVRRGAESGIWAEIGEGIRIVACHPVLRSLAGRNATFNLFNNMGSAVYLLYVTRDLGIQPAMLGVVAAVVGPAPLLAATAAHRLPRRFGVGPVLAVAALLEGGGALLILAAGVRSLAALPMLVLAQAAFGLATPTWNINQVTLRQAITPGRLLGRVNATMRFMALGLAPLGALVGGALGETIGLRPTLGVAAAGTLLASIWVLVGPVRALRETPRPLEDPLPVPASRRTPPRLVAA